MKSIPIKPPFSVPPAITEICHKLEQQGFRAWLAGGCVRDLIMKRKPRDWDVVTDAPFERLREFFPQGLDVGAAFGILKLPPDIDIAIFRKEEGYSDKRHPDKVEPGTLETDVERRDFTVNALYYDPFGACVVDCVSGTKDIDSKVIRAVGVPVKRFTEDALRVVRAARFVAQLGFKIDRETSAAMKKCSVYVESVSRERIREELWRLLSSSKPIMGLEALAQYGLWEQVFGVRRVSVPADLRHLKLNWVPTPLHWICALGVTGLLGDPLKEAEEISERITEKLRLSNIEKKIFHQVLLTYKEAHEESPLYSPGDWVELARSEKQIIELLKAFVRRARGPSQEEKDRTLSFLDQIVRWAIKPGAEKEWPSATELQKEGIKPGPALGRTLKKRQWEAFWKRPV